MLKKSKSCTISHALQLLGFTTRGGKRMRKAEQLRRMIQYEGCGFDAALQHLLPFIQSQAMPDLCDMPPEKRDSVVQKWLTLQMYSLRLYHLAGIGQVKPSMLQREASKDLHVPRRTLRRWQSRFRLNGISGLIDRRGDYRLYREEVMTNNRSII